MQCTNPFHLKKGRESSVYFSLNFSYITVSRWIHFCLQALSAIHCFISHIHCLFRATHAENVLCYPFESKGETERNVCFLKCGL